MLDLYTVYLRYIRFMSSIQMLHVEERDGRWWLAGVAAPRFSVVNEFLGYVADRRFSPRTARAYAFDLLAFCRWLVDERLDVDGVSTDVLLRFLTHCRTATLPGRPGGNVYSIRDGRNVGYSAATINRRLAAISGLFSFRQMRDPSAANPVPRGQQARRATAGERSGLLAHLAKPGLVHSFGCANPAGCRGPGPGRDAGVAGQLPYRPGPGDRRADAVLRAAFGRGTQPACV